MRNWNRSSENAPRLSIGELHRWRMIEWTGFVQPRDRILKVESNHSPLVPKHSYGKDDTETE